MEIFVNIMRLTFSCFDDIIKQKEVKMMDNKAMKNMNDKDLYLCEVGKRILERRKQLRLTQEELAEKGNLSTQLVSSAELGKRGLRAENLLKLSIALDVSVDYLLTGDIVDKDKIILIDKLQNYFNVSQLRAIENIIEECKIIANP